MMNYQSVIPKLGYSEEEAAHQLLRHIEDLTAFLKGNEHEEWAGHIKVHMQTLQAFIEDDIEEGGEA